MKRIYNWLLNLSWGWVFTPSYLIIALIIIPDKVFKFIVSYFGINFVGVFFLSNLLFHAIVAYIKREVPYLRGIRGIPAMIISGVCIIGLLFLIIGLSFFP